MFLMLRKNRHPFVLFPRNQCALTCVVGRLSILYDTRTASASSANSSTGVVASLTGHSSWVLSADISPDGRLAASGSSDQTVKIWDIAARQCVSTLTDQSGDVWGVSWRPTPVLAPVLWFHQVMMVVCDGGDRLGQAPRQLPNKITDACSSTDICRNLGMQLIMISCKAIQWDMS
ncbi:hypothetical protein BS47DRAFT_608820 [Hydnum rufescens UP504]|uniref:Uncharacterized protein n=1 Tax=Hydnum rufescens UP504 TaxID=1448309 RepID=A0A9P6DVW4_9AGAM|nr:hypothetical protein BS47DRAFT_608820 [Hydnum rufescens UP504]